MNNTLDFRAMKQVEELNKKGYYIACDMDILERFMFKYTRISKILTLMGVCFIIWCVTIYWGITTVSADYNELSIQDQIRLERLEVCQEALKESSLHYNQAEMAELVIKCTQRMIWVYIMESGTGKDEIRTNNFLWLKRTVNGQYWFHSFKTGRECRKYFATKYFKFHYKKSPRTFIYGFWIDNQWKFGWSVTDKEIYTNFLTNVENNQELTNELNYLYFTR